MLYNVHFTQPYDNTKARFKHWTVFVLSEKKRKKESFNSAAAKGCFWKMTPAGGITRYHLLLLIEDSMGYVVSGVAFE